MDSPRPFRRLPELSWTDDAGQHKVLVGGRTTLGSAPGAEVRISDREVSRLHAELEPTDRGTWVRDLGSRNGTYVENLLVEAALLPNAARIRLGGTELVLRYPAQPSPVRYRQPFKDFRERWIDHGEREYLRRLLERHGRNVLLAADEAGLDRTYLYRLIRKHGL